ncbi:MAG: acyltransferase [Caulobacteraceae bacterium]
MTDVIGADAHKRVFHTLDGMRGIAAVAVLLRHIPLTARWSIPGSYLAVDLFFALSGFVLAYSNHHRLVSASAGRWFMLQRLVRLYPLYILGTLLCLALRPDLGLGAAVPLALVFLPGPSAAGKANLGALYPYNPPAWSLLYELIANLAYAFLARLLSMRVLIAILVVSGVVLVGECFHRGSLDLGSDYATKAGGVIRVTFSFFAGVMVFRLWKAGWRVPKLPALLVALAPVALFLVPGSRRLVDPVEVIAIFPLLILAGASNDPAGATSRRLLVFSGEISYPLYVLQAALLLAGGRLAPWALGEGAGRTATPAVLAFILVAIAVSWLAYRFYDAPVRGYLRDLLKRKRPYPAGLGAR